MPIISGKWTWHGGGFDNSVDISESPVNFTSNGTSYSGIVTQGDTVAYIESNSGRYIRVFRESWSNNTSEVGPDANPNHRYVDFGESVQNVSDTFYKWFIRHADPEKACLSGKWMWNEKVEDYYTGESYSVNFTSNGNTYTQMYLDHAWMLTYIDSKGNSAHVYTGEWSEEDYGEGPTILYREVDFGESEQKVSVAFYKWFTRNAYKIATISGKWKWNERVNNYHLGDKIDIDFTSNDQSFIGIQRYNGWTLRYILPDKSFIDVYSGSWSDNTDYIGPQANPKHRYIDFGTEPRTVSDYGFYIWFTANATVCDPDDDGETDDDHEVIDDDFYFSIDPPTKAINYLDEGSIIIAKGDHNSERCTFEIPRIIEGHDMSLCDKVEVHYLNMEAGASKNRSGDVYRVKDLQISTNDPNTVMFTWLISQNATRYAGSLSFAIRFSCSRGAGIYYTWRTGMFNDIAVIDTIDNSHEAVELHSDVLQSWYSEFLMAGTMGINDIHTAKSEAVSSIEEVRDEAIERFADSVHEEVIDDVTNAVLSNIDKIRDDILEDINKQLSDVDDKVVKDITDSIEKDMTEKLPEITDKIVGNIEDSVKEELKEDMRNDLYPSVAPGLGHKTIVANDLSTNEATGENSSTFGSHGVAATKDQMVRGRYNVSDVPIYDDGRGRYADIIGGGTSNDDRKNIHTVDWDGTAYYSGNLELEDMKSIKPPSGRGIYGGLMFLGQHNATDGKKYINPVPIEHKKQNLGLPMYMWNAIYANMMYNKITEVTYAPSISISEPGLYFVNIQFRQNGSIRFNLTSMVSVHNMDINAVGTNSMILADNGSTVDCMVCAHYNSNNRTIAIRSSNAAYDFGIVGITEIGILNDIATTQIKISQPVIAIDKNILSIYPQGDTSPDWYDILIDGITKARTTNTGAKTTYDLSTITGLSAGNRSVTVVAGKVGCIDSNPSNSAMFTASETTEYILDGHWKWKDEVDMSGVEGASFTAAFTSNDVKYLKIEISGSILSYIKYIDGATVPIYSTKWDGTSHMQDKDMKCRYIDFGESKQYVTEKFYKWFIANAIRVDTIEGHQWRFNTTINLAMLSGKDLTDYIDNVGYVNFNIKFTSGGISGDSFTKMRMHTADGTLQYCTGDEEIEVYNNGEWVHSDPTNIKYIYLSPTKQKVSVEFYEWFTANATCVSK